MIPDAELSEALVLGPAADCRARLAELAASLQLAWPVLDLTGLKAEATLRNLEASRRPRVRVDSQRDSLR